MTAQAALPFAPHRHLEFFAASDGDPAPQGSKRHVGRGVMVESSKRVRPWQAIVTDAACKAMEASGWPIGDRGIVVAVSLTFIFRRPDKHFRKAGLRLDAPEHQSHAPDADKLARAVLDALTAAGIYHDDGQVAVLTATKLYAGRDAGERPGVAISVEELRP